MSEEKMKPNAINKELEELAILAFKEVSGENLKTSCQWSVCHCAAFGPGYENNAKREYLEAHEDYSKR